MGRKRARQIEDIVRRQRAEACVKELRALLKDDEVESAIALIQAPPDEPDDRLDVDEPVFPEFVGALLRQRRIAEGFDQASLSYAARMHWRTISEWELTSGKNPKVNQLSRVAQVLGCTVDDFLQDPHCAIESEEDEYEEEEEAREAG